VANNGSCGRGCGHSAKIVIFHLLIAAAPGRINRWFNEGVVTVLAGACSTGVDVRTGITALFIIMRNRRKLNRVSETAE
jgi:hypothetical protein